MKPSPLTLGAIYLTFFSLLTASGLIGNETISDALYYLAFIISSLAGVLLTVFYRKIRHGMVVNEDTASSFKQLQASDTPDISQTYPAYAIPCASGGSYSFFGISTDGSSFSLLRN